MTQYTPSFFAFQPKLQRSTEAPQFYISNILKAKIKLSLCFEVSPVSKEIWD